MVSLTLAEAGLVAYNLLRCNALWRVWTAGTLFFKGVVVKNSEVLIIKADNGPQNV